ncbi:sugar transporter [Shewanella sp. NFH-SH190041]|uniref:SLBB domain-containing protein n=1 Tax=Shewanella sp. NFH-SH190041 TaxID=2950245 RepID=UPI0021C3A3A8|nr:SLBB domain-containing protein [Shewanella sp. NFH-SH190041]BDM65200.1 sugar transporter [Shewanella sp. NFH-SH190041]
MLHKTKKLFITGLCVLATLTGYAQAFTPSPQMIEQFKQLPHAEQERIARQYGIDLNMLGDNASTSQKLESPQVVTPRVDELKDNDKKVSVELNSTSALKHAKDSDDKKPLRRFGIELFAGSPTTFAPVSDVPVPSEYIVGPGDNIKIQLYGKENENYTLLVGRDGSIQFPELGPIPVAGMSFSELRTSLSKQISHQMLGVDSNITMGELRSIRIFVAGDAYKPGSYTVSSLSTITQALFVAGGVNDIGSLRNIQVKRNGKLVGIFDLYDLLMRGDASGDIRLQSGDVVFIPAVKNQITVTGEVRRPAIYELKNGDDMADVITMAAGIKNGAYPKVSTIERFNTLGLKTLVNVDLTSSKGKKLIAQSGDVLNVKSATNQFEDAITIVGAVVRPGKYQWSKGQRISDLLPSIWGDLAISADLDYGLLIREVNKFGDVKVYQFAPGKAIINKDIAQNLILQPRDKIIIFNFNDETKNRYELNKLVKQRVAKATALTDDSLIGNDLFKAGFAQLQQRTLTERHELGGVVVNDHKKNLNDDKQKLISGEVNKMLANLFEDKDLIKLSGEMNRAELLYPIVVKLNSQSRAGDGVKVVAINGEVRYPGIYPLPVDGKALDLITAAGGLKDGAYTERAELSRTVLGDQESSITHLNIALTKALDGDKTANTVLKSRDILTVMTTPDWQDYQSVEIRGEVKFPGIYNIRRGETLHDVLKRAGGFTSYAYLPAAVFVRESVRKQEALEVKQLADQLRRDIATRGVSKDGNVTNYKDAQLMLTDLESIKPVGRLVVDLPAIALGVKQADLQLENQDVLYIPSTKQTIAVMGEVQHAATLRYKKGLTVDDYIEMSGGPRRRADDSHTYVIKADGSVMIPKNSFWFTNRDKLIPGDTIIVPLDTEYKDHLSLWTQVTQIIYNSAVAFATVAKL